MIARLQHITQDNLALTHVQQVRLALEGGAKWCQLRIKADISPFQKVHIAQEIRTLTLKYKAIMIVNDDVGLAETIDADGVHLGKSDMDPERARSVLGPRKIIGGTANSIEDVQKVKDHVNYFGVGPFRFTNTKTNLSPVLEKTGYENLMSEMADKGIKLPVIAVGGILQSDIKELLQIGIHGVAIASAINSASDPKEETNLILQSIENFMTYASS